MTKLELLEELRAIAQRKDQDLDLEQGHVDADDAIIAFIDDPDIKAAYEAIEKWYA